VGKGVRFEFDTANLDHIALHEVERREILQAFKGKKRIFAVGQVNGEPRWKLVGKTAKGRYLTVIFTIRKGKIRPVTAHTMHQKERKLYAKDIDEQIA
jgi:uncharacterized DUF497 family protein